MRTRADTPNPTEQLTYWASRFELFSAEDARSLLLLRTIENTLDNFRRLQSFLELFSGIVREEGDKLVSNLSDHVLDKDGILLGKLLSAQKSLKEHYEELRSWCEDVKVGEYFGREDEIVEECSKYLSSLLGIHNYINELRWKIAEHDADYAKKTGSFKTVEELIGYLNNPRS